jgi:Membrane bound FAD containing D-sorbitol dehydrogenase
MRSAHYNRMLDVIPRPSAHISRSPGVDVPLISVQGDGEGKAIVRSQQPCERLEEAQMPGLQQTYPADEREFDRRAFLGGSLLVLGGVALGRISPAGAAPPAELQGFLELSRIATGVENLPRRLAPKYLRALDAAPRLRLTPSRFLQLAGYASGRGPKSLRALEQSAAFRTEGGRACVDAVAAAWWSGIVPVPGGGEQVVTFSEALVWRALPFAEPPSVCLGATGAWAKPGRRV